MTDLQQEITKASSRAAMSRKTAKRIQLWLLVTAVLLAISVSVIVALLHNAENRAESSGAQVVTEQTEKKEIAQEAQQALCGTKDTEIFDKELCEKLAAAAQEPVTLPEDPPVTIGPSRADLVQAFRVYCSEGDNCKGADGAAPTADDIAAAFMRFCSDGRCTGPAGQNGKDAEPQGPEYEMVLAAVTEHCSTGVCVGRPGIDGANATQEMVLAAVQTACANEACRGPAGPEGPGGPKGEPGRGIAEDGLYCQDNGLWQITYTDGKVDADGGKCRADVTLANPPSALPSLNP